MDSIYFGQTILIFSLLQLSKNISAKITGFMRRETLQPAISFSQIEKHSEKTLRIIRPNTTYADNLAPVLSLP